jgi:effector-binding domain-containing protein
MKPARHREKWDKWMHLDSKLYREVAVFNDFCGNLCSHLRPKNLVDDKKNVTSTFHKAVEFAFLNARSILVRRRVDEGDENYHRYVFNHGELRRMYHKWMKAEIGVKQKEYRISQTLTIAE